METIENNKLIAEFMGWTEDFDLITHTNDKWWSDPKTHKYHKSLDWLRPVVIKIEQDCEGVPQELLNISLYSDINEVYNAVVEFIKRYNKQN